MLKKYTIKKIQARQIINSRGYPTVEVDVYTDDGIRSTASVPSGASKSKHEAVELLDNDSNNYLGYGVQQAIIHIQGILSKTLEGISIFDQTLIDQIMIKLDGTSNKQNLGANSLLSISLAVLKLAAKVKGVPLYQYLNSKSSWKFPAPMMNVINGGYHADNQLDFQEFMIIPTVKESFAEALKKGVEVFHYLKDILKQRKLSTNLGDEGGFAPNLSSNEAAIECILEAIEKARYQVNQDITLGIDAAASTFYKTKTRRYYLKYNQKKAYTSEEMVVFWKELTKKYPIKSLEDPMAEDDWEGWSCLNKELGDKITLIGDDLFATNTARLQKGIKVNIANGCIIKPNQVGTITETKAAIQLAQKSGYTVVLSHRSGETEETSLVDLALGYGVDQVKWGAPARSERTAKYNRLLRIESRI